MKKLLLVVLVSIVAFVLVVAYLMYSASYPPRNPPPTIGVYWDTTDTQGFEDVYLKDALKASNGVRSRDTTDTQGFEDVYPKAEDARAPTFTLSRGRTGVAVIIAYLLASDVKSDVKMWNASLSIESLPGWVTVAFDPAQFVIETDQKTRVNVSITATPPSPTINEITFTFTCLPLGEKIEGAMLESSFTLKII